MLVFLLFTLFYNLLQHTRVWKKYLPTVHQPKRVRRGLVRDFAFNTYANLLNFFIEISDPSRRDEQGRTASNILQICGRNMNNLIWDMKHLLC